MSELTTDLIVKSLNKLKKGYWFTPKYPTKYKRVRVTCCPCCCHSDQKFHYEKIAVRFRKGKRKFLFLSICS